MKRAVHLGGSKYFFSCMDFQTGVSRFHSLPSAVLAAGKSQPNIRGRENAEEGMLLMRNILLFPHVVQVILRKA